MDESNKRVNLMYTIVYNDLLSNCVILVERMTLTLTKETFLFGIVLLLLNVVKYTIIS